MKKPIAIMLVALLGLPVAGCGGDDDEDKRASTGSEAAEKAATEAASRASRESRRAGRANARRQTIEVCKRRITTQPGTSPQLRADLEAICEEGASGDENRRREAAEKVCRRLVEEGSPPDAAARPVLLKNCEQPAAP
jgi:hypothetical protein